MSNVSSPQSHGPPSEDPSGEAPKREVAAALRASRELGPEYDDAIAASVTEHIDRMIDERVRAHVATHLASAPASRVPDMRIAKMRLAMGIVSLVLAVPLTAIAGVMAGPAGVIVAWVGLMAFFLMVVGARR